MSSLLKQTKQDQIESETEILEEDFTITYNPKKHIKYAVHQDERNYLVQDKRKYIHGRFLKNSKFYETNYSNEKYVKYYELRYKAFENSNPWKIPIHPREKHRCAYHLQDFFNSLSDREVSLYGSFVQYLNCLSSEPGLEPERLREEIWM